MSRLIEVCQDDIICGDDGYFIFWPTENKGGLSAANLRALADHLDSRNEYWDAQIQAYHKEEENNAR